MNRLQNVLIDAYLVVTAIVMALLLVAWVVAVSLTVFLLGKDALP